MANYDDTATVSGSVVSFADGADDVPTKSIVVTIPPTLSGVSSLNEKQIPSRNMASMSDADFTLNSVHYYTENGVLYIDGTSTSETSSNNNAFKVLDFWLPSGTYYFSRGTTLTSLNVPAYLRKYDDKSQIVVNTGSFTLSEKTHLYIGLYVYQKTFSNIKAEICINLGSTAITYEDTSPIEQYTASLGRTIYGGQADIVNGTGKETHKGYTLDNLTWSGGIVGGADWCWYIDLSADGLKLPANSEIFSGICDNYTPIRYNGVATNQNTIALRSNGFLYVNNGSDTTEPTGKVTIELGTPTDFTFTGQEIPTRLGYNAFWSDSGDTELTYYKSGYGFTSVTVNRTGKNLLENNIEDGSTGGISYSKNADGSISCVGTVSNVNATRLINTVTLPIGNYILSGADSSINLRAVLYDGTGTAVTNRNDTGNGVTISVYSTIAYIEFRIKARTASEVVNTIISPMLAVGSSVLPYEPYEAVSKTAYLHKVIYGGTADVISGKAEPKNLAELSAITYDQSQKCTWEYTNGGVVITATGTYARVGFVIPVKTGKTYTISYRGFSDAGYRRVYLNSTSAWSGQFYNNFLTETDTAYTYTFTATTNTLFIGLYVTAGTTTGAMTFSELMLEEGSTASEYVPHFEPFSFPPISMSTDEGENTLFANEGASAIVYRKEI